MKKQRWRFTKTPLKKWKCDSCWRETKVVKDYKPWVCCDGRECGCYGLPINPVFCEKCEDKFDAYYDKEESK
jgi:hypothetical protein